MSSCPNCKSPVDRSSAYQRTTHTTKFICGGLLLHTGGEAKLIETEACDLIRSLREERDQLQEGLADAHQQLYRIGLQERDAERDRIADHLELRASKLEDELAISETSSEVGLERMLAVIKSLRREAQAIRNNEHRSNG